MLAAVVSCWSNPVQWRDCGKVFKFNVFESDFGTFVFSVVLCTRRSDGDFRVIAAANTETDVPPPQNCLGIVTGWPL